MKKPYERPGYSITGRLINNKPNIQNIPIRTELGRKMRDAFQGMAMEGLGPDHVYVYTSECALEILFATEAKFYGNKV